MVFDSDYRDVTVLTHESWPQSAEDTEWMYMTSLFIDTRFLQDVCNAVLNARYAVDRWETARSDDKWTEVDTAATRFSDNDAQVTFDRCSSTNEYEVADRWLSLVRQQSDVTNHLNVNITGVNLAKMPATDESPHAHVYEKMLRDHLIDARSRFYGESMQVDYGHYHPLGPQQRDEDFARILHEMQDPLTTFSDVTFLSDDHHSHGLYSKEWELAHLLQLADVLSNSVAALFTTDHLVHKKQKLSWLAKDLVQNSMEYDGPTVDRFTVSFYPREDTAGNVEDEFYYWRRIQRKDPHRESLDRFMA